DFRSTLRGGRGADHLGTLPGQRLGDRLAYTSCRAGDQCHSRVRHAHSSASSNRAWNTPRHSVGRPSIARRRAASGFAANAESFMCRPPPSLADALFEPWLRPARSGVLRALLGFASLSALIPVL